MKRPNKEYGIRAMVCDWALDISMGDATFVLYFNSRNNAELVKAVLEWEYTHPNEAAPYQLAIPNLHPISREQVEKVFPGCRACKSCRSCVFCINNPKDMPCKECDPNAECAVSEYKPSNFCPVCGKPLTDEAVQMVMERLEALRDE